MSDPSKRGKATSDPVRIERDGELTIVAFDSPPLKLFDERLARGLEEAASGLESGDNATFRGR